MREVTYDFGEHDASGYERPVSAMFKTVGMCHIPASACEKVKARVTSDEAECARQELEDIA